MKQYDVIVIGAGHAGCEAAYTSTRLGAKVALITLRKDRIAQMSCNPAIGGVGKGHLVREVDALGGAMAQIADATGIQFRRLNMSRGAAVRSRRAQSDSEKYKNAMTEFLLGINDIDIIEGEAVDILKDNNMINGVVLDSQTIIYAKAVVVTTGTFLNGLCHIGEEKFNAGRVGDIAATKLSNALIRLGLKLERFKTGTTPRLAKDSIDYSKLEAQHGDETKATFSFDYIKNELPQIACYITFTNAVTNEAVLSNLHRSPLYQGEIIGRGPRYCPSFEDKLVRFADKERHQIFLEPEGIDSDRVYPNGLPTSMPKDVQDAFVHSIVGLEKAHILQYGYAVEYDYAPPTQLLPSLMAKCQPGIFLAGQINGTSGYEEAAAQGVMVGLNAVRFLDNKPAAILGRNQGYIGVMIDDLVTKGVDEPYRMFTSRAEHRLVLRESNAEMRLTEIAKDWGIVSGKRFESANKRINEINRLHDALKHEKLGEELANQLNLDKSFINATLYELLKRPEISLENIIEQRKEKIDREIIQCVEEAIKYEGYIKKEEKEIARQQELENYQIPKNIKYENMPGLSRELREKLNKVQPKTLGQASRVPGMTPAAVSLLRVKAYR
ncbi:MAG: tRNA uridine-5-carboxymethylaminomethyl(34) synthesis enzyme MnmG [Deltaproteobacteria bacterium]|nr:tRNA uridine-5-carboxymethylaminomethyl(34) synthesis enzyme MnmG [Deltaproteobacteria bacterium]